MARVYLLPSLLGDAAPIDSIAPATLAVIRRLEYFVVETPKAARRYLKAAGVTLANPNLSVKVLNEHTREADIEPLLSPIQRGQDLGIMTDAGCPGIADPGARLVRLAHEHGIPVTPMVGPSAILLALMASGLEGQRFAFHGYLPVDAHAKGQAIKSLEAQSRRLQQTQIFIEAPYRNRRMFDALIAHCSPGTLLSIATDLTLPDEAIGTLSIERWRSAPAPNIERRPTVFLLLASANASDVSESRDFASRHRP